MQSDFNFRSAWMWLHQVGRRSDSAKNIMYAACPCGILPKRTVVRTSYNSFFSINDFKLSLWNWVNIRWVEGRQRHENVATLIFPISAPLFNFPNFGFDAHPHRWSCIATQENSFFFFLSFKLFSLLMQHRDQSQNKSLKHIYPTIFNLSSV